MAYQYDVFLSYKRTGPHGEWVNDIFLPLFEPYLTDALNQKVRIFQDTQKIQGGDAWASHLKQALVHSKVMVAILAPAYFMSEWCVKEFTIMDFRQKKLGFTSDTNKSGLILPIQLFDGDHFPARVKQLQMLNCTKVNRVGKSMIDSPLYLDLQGVLLDWVEDVADAIKKSPEWDKKFGTKAFIDTPTQKLDLLTQPDINQAPKL